jgi:uncharacterized protein YhhL (DUF1145 family)
MPSSSNILLIIAALLSGIAALLHVGIVFGGAAWYRFFGAGERMATAAAAGRRYPAIVTFGIASMLALWAAYALSGAGMIPPLPLLKAALSVITAVYLLRGLVAVAMLIGARDRLTPFWIWSSAICLMYGVVHLLGLAQAWKTL